ncbi:MAG TPA: hypothetical protein VN766_17015 [Stellaceae bacterium]|nr:hypothetical protein [Stellaceae bacterium]
MTDEEWQQKNDDEKFDWLRTNVTQLIRFVNGQSRRTGSIQSDAAEHLATLRKLAERVQALEAAAK